MMRSTVEIMMRSTGEIMMRSTEEIMMRSTGEIMMRSTGEIMMRSTGEIMMRSTGEIMLRITREIMMRSTGEITTVQLENTGSYINSNEQGKKVETVRYSAFTWVGQDRTKSVYSTIISLLHFTMKYNNIVHVSSHVRRKYLCIYLWGNTKLACKAECVIK